MRKSRIKTSRSKNGRERRTCRGCGGSTLSKLGYCSRTEECRRLRANVRQRKRYREGAGARNCIYVIGCNEFTPVKIGYTKYTIAQRLIRLQTGCPFELKIVACFPGSMDTEKLLHRSLREYRVRGEWFEFGESDAVDVIEGIYMSLIGKSSFSDLCGPPYRNGAWIIYLRYRFCARTQYRTAIPIHTVPITDTDRT